MVNDVRGSIGGRLKEIRTALVKKAEEEQLKREAIDITFPARKNNVGHNHLNIIAPEEVEHAFVGMGYEVVEGPEVEYDRYSFEKLNIPKDHPARDEQDAFYISENILLRGQTSPTQVRTMEQGKPPVHMIALSCVLRSDEVGAARSPSFHQIESLAIDKNITFADLKGTLAELTRELFGPEVEVKLRLYHFPSTEPSVEVDVTYSKCGGSGCRFCKGPGWTEIPGCDMVYPRVLETYGVDLDAYSEFVSGVGLEHTALLKCGIDDMCLLYGNNIHLLKQF